MKPASEFRWLGTVHDMLWPRWVFLRALGLIFFSAFYALAFQIRGLIGTRGILPAADYFSRIASVVSVPTRYWYAPTLFWFDASDAALMTGAVVGLIASV